MGNATRDATLRAQGTTAKKEARKQAKAQKSGKKRKQPKVPPKAQAAGAKAGSEMLTNIFDAIDVPSGSEAIGDPPSSQRAALDRLWAWIRLGDPAAIVAYEPKLVSKIGASDMLGRLHNLRPNLQNATLRVASTRGTKLGTLVVVRQKPHAKGAKSHEVSYLLVKKNGGWIVTYDGILNELLVANAFREATRKAQQKIDANAKQPSAEAQAAGAAAATKERKLLNSVVPDELQSTVAPKQPKQGNK